MCFEIHKTTVHFVERTLHVPVVDGHTWVSVDTDWVLKSMAAGGAVAVRGVVAVGVSVGGVMAVGGVMI